ncbi:MAG: DUF4907 domain-containing protein [Flavobacteriaceae bacterium]|nr:DUF4907 domain-containing protein [Flavobacteriaceae bacterium]
MEKKISYLAVVSIIFTVVLSITLLTTPNWDTSPTEYHSRIAQVSDSQQWYYEIYQNNQLIIKQKHIPGVKGIQHFKSKEEAWKVAEVVLEKLEKGDSPSVSKKELEELSITFKSP